MKKTINSFIFILTFAAISFSQTLNINKKDGSTVTYNLSDILNITFSISETNTVTDIDGNVYKTVKIGNQWWMAENLKVTHYRNGDPIAHVTYNSEWKSLTGGAYCNYENNEYNVSTYGRLYNGYARIDSRNIAPEGWHIPSDEEWQTLIDYLGGSDVAGRKLKEAGTVHWNSPNTGATNESGFTALPGGYRNYSTANFDRLGTHAYIWSSTAGIYRILRYDYSSILKNSDVNRAGFSVRCVKD